MAAGGLKKKSQTGTRMWSGQKRRQNIMPMNTPYKLFVTSVNMMQEHIEIIATETSLSTNGIMPEENTMLRYSTNNTGINRQ